MQSFNNNSSPSDGSDSKFINLCRLNFHVSILVGTGNCWEAATNTNGAAVTLQPCVIGLDSQTWTFTAGSPSVEGTNGAGGTGSISVFGNMCLDVTNGVNESGTRLQIYDCTEGDANQMWQASTISNGLQTVSWVGSTRCIDLTGGTQTADTPVRWFLYSIPYWGLSSYRYGPVPRGMLTRSGLPSMLQQVLLPSSESQFSLF